MCTNMINIITGATEVCEENPLIFDLLLCNAHLNTILSHMILYIVHIHCVYVHIMLTITCNYIECCMEMVVSCSGGMQGHAWD